MKINLLFPVFNEERRLEKGILKTLIFLTKNKVFEYQLTIVDNGSTDRTEEISRALCEKHLQLHYLKTTKKGVGVAFRTGVAQNSCEIVGMMDIDLSTDLNHLWEVKSVFEKQAQVQIIKGSRLIKGAQVIGRKAGRELTSRGLNSLLHRVFNNHFSDALCGFDFYRKETIESLIQMSGEEEDWFYGVELLLRAERMGTEIYEIPVVWEDDYDSKVKLFKTIRSYLKQIYTLKQEFEKDDRRFLTIE